MTTALILINDAFNDLEIKSSEVDLSPAEIATGVRYLNRLMVTFAAGGINVGYAKATDETDETEIPDWFEDVVVSHLAIRLAPAFGIQVNAALVAAAGASMKIVERRIVELHPVQFPNTLPIGNGNYQGDNTKFFLNDTDGDLEGGNGQILDDDESVTLSTD